MLRKTSSDLSAWWMGLCFSLFGGLASGVLALEPSGCWMGLRLWGGNSSLQEDSHQCMLIKTAVASVFVPRVSHSPTPPTSARDPPIIAGRSSPVSYEITVLSPESWYLEVLVYSFSEWNFCFSQFCGISSIKLHWPSKLDSLGASLPITRSSGWEAWHEVQGFQSCGRTSVV